jgi:hypothetical protein
MTACSDVEERRFSAAIRIRVRARLQACRRCLLENNRGFSR